MPQEFKVPELGENVGSATVAKVLISKGQAIKREQPVMELETDKAVLEVPSDVDGTVVEVLVKEGDEVEVGRSLFTVRCETEPRGKRKTFPEGDRKASGVVGKEKPVQENKEHRGADDSGRGRKPRTRRKGNASPAEAETAGRDAGAGRSAEPIPAAPSVRRFAREVGVDILAVAGSGPRGRIGIEDIKNHVRSRAAGNRPDSADSSRNGPARALPDFSRWGETEREPMTRVRRLTAERMSRAWSVIPHVTQFGKADVTEIERLRLQYKADAEKAGGRLTLMVILIKTVAGALKAFPRFNAGVDAERNEIVIRKYCNIGIAMDTDRGLVVPVIRDADGKNMIEISVDLRRITDEARAGKLAVEDLQGGCFTISNAGALGGDVFTPIINWPEAAILGMARTRTEAVHRDGAFVPRLMLPLALSYDHRIIDGADGVRFMRWIVEAIEEPVKLLWEG